MKSKTAFIEISSSPLLLTCAPSFFSSIFYLHLLLFSVSSFVALKHLPLVPLAHHTLVANYCFGAEAAPSTTNSPFRGREVTRYVDNPRGLIKLFYLLVVLSPCCVEYVYLICASNFDLYIQPRCRCRCRCRCQWAVFMLCCDTGMSLGEQRSYFGVRML